jgi:short-subunit dehydrogenase
MAAQLKTDFHIEAKGFAADVMDRDSLVNAFTEIKKTYGFIDVLEFSPAIPVSRYQTTLEVTPASALYEFEFQVLAALTAIQQVLPAMLEKKTGALLFTTGVSSVQPVPSLSNVGISTSGLRNYLANLHNAVAPNGIYVGHLAIGVMIQPGQEGDPDTIADIWYNQYDKQEQFETIFPHKLQFQGQP